MSNNSNLIDFPRYSDEIKLDTSLFIPKCFFNFIKDFLVKNCFYQITPKESEKIEEHLQISYDKIEYPQIITSQENSNRFVTGIYNLACSNKKDSSSKIWSQVLLPTRNLKLISNLENTHIVSGITSILGLLENGCMFLFHNNDHSHLKNNHYQDSKPKIIAWNGENTHYQNFHPYPKEVSDIIYDLEIFLNENYIEEDLLFYKDYIYGLDLLRKKSLSYTN